MGCDCGANAAPGLFSVQPFGPRRRKGKVVHWRAGELEALGPSFGVARSGKTHSGIAASLAP